ncbi:hypothetical protein FACS189454_09580 [Planctomycetales bacterium]|nr:hypothetical protein FACS189454_09580 [Planctomycetales bacterium]
MKGKFVSTKEGDLAADIATKIAAGIPYQSSIFFDDPEDGELIEIEEVKKNKTVTVNGKEFTGEGIVIRKWLLRGVAACLYGADSQTSTNILKFQQEGGISQMDPKEVLKQFTELFGSELANQYFTDGLDIDAATKKFNGILQSQLAESKNLAAAKESEIAELKNQLAALSEKEKELAASVEKVAELEKKLGEAEAKLDVWNKQYGGLPYGDLANAQNGNGTPNGNAANEYSAELKSVLG